MIPLQSVPGQVAGWLWAIAALLVPGAIASVLWTPFLLSGRIRALFRRLPPVGSVAITYPVVTLAASLPYVLGTLAAITLAHDGGESGAAMANAILSVVLPLSIGYAVGVPALAAVVLPRLGVDWDPTGYGAGTWALLAGGAAWYAAVFAVPLFAVAVILAFPA